MFQRRLTGKTDEELMRLIQEREGRALTELYNRYSKPIVRYFYRMLWQDENKAQDFLHDLFVKLIERPHLFDTKKKFSTWIYSVAHNMCKNEYRKDGFRTSAEIQMRPETHVESTIGDDMDKQLFMKTLDRAMRTWEEEDRSLFVFRHELDMTFAEMAVVLGCPEGTVKSRWFYLRKQLADDFQAFHVILKVI